MVGKQNATHRVKKKSQDAKERKSNMAQDLNYATMKKVQEAKQVKKIKESLHHIAEAGSKAKHTIFLDNKKQKRKFTPEEHFDTVDELAMRHHNRPRKSTLATKQVLGLAAGATGEKQLKKILKTQKQTYDELAQREVREGKLEGLMTDIALEKQAMGKGRKRKINGTDGVEESGKPVFKWKKERKR